MIMILTINVINNIVHFEINKVKIEVEEMRTRSAIATVKSNINRQKNKTRNVSDGPSQICI